MGRERVKKVQGFGLLLAGLALGAPWQTGMAEDIVGWNSPLRPQMELTTQLTEKLNIRFGLNRIDPKTTAYWGDGYQTTPRRDLGMSASALVDWEFAPGGVRVTGGALYGDLGWSTLRSGQDALATRSGAAPLDDFSGSTVTPYLGLGWDKHFGAEGRLGLQLDMGFVFEGVPAVNGEGSESNLDRLEEEATLRQSFESFRYTPMFSAGVQYRF